MSGPAAPAGPVLREADWRDVAAMAQVERRAFADDPWTEHSLWGELALRPRRTYLVADSTGDGPGGRLWGHAGLDLAGEVADVMTIAVDPDARGQGLGGRLLAALHERALAAGADAVMLEVRADNVAARGLYESRGYRTVSTRRGYYRDPGGAPPVDALVLRKELHTQENGAEVGTDPTGPAPEVGRKVAR